MKVMTKNELIESIGMVNGNYKYCSSNIYSFSKYIGIPADIVREWFRFTNKMLERSIKTSIERLTKDSKIKCKEITVVSLDEGSKQVKYMLSPEEEIELKKLENNIIIDMGLNNKKEVYATGRWKEFNGVFRSILMDMLGIIDIYQAYQFDLLIEVENKDTKEIDTMKTEMNDSLSEKINTNAKNRYKRAEKKSDETRFYENYIEENKRLTDVLINLSSPNIIQDIKKINKSTNSKVGVMGIYKITNTQTGKVYIGSSIEMSSRFKQHYENLKMGKHHNEKLQNDYNIYGESYFKFETLEIIDNIDDLPEKEYYWIRQYGGLYGDIVYNVSNPLLEHHLSVTRSI